MGHHALLDTVQQLGPHEHVCSCPPLIALLQLTAWSCQLLIALGLLVCSTRINSMMLTPPIPAASGLCGSLNSGLSSRQHAAGAGIVWFTFGLCAYHNYLVCTGLGAQMRKRATMSGSHRSHCCAPRSQISYGAMHAFDACLS